MHLTQPKDAFRQIWKKLENKSVSANAAKRFLEQKFSTVFSKKPLLLLIDEVSWTRKVYVLVSYQWIISNVCVRSLTWYLTELSAWSIRFWTGLISQNWSSLLSLIPKIWSRKLLRAVLKVVWYVEKFDYKNSPFFSNWVVSNFYFWSLVPWTHVRCRI